jgi:hypothetical protein
MQTVTPSLALGAQGQFSLEKQTVHNSFGGVYDKDDNLIAAQWDKNVS